MEHLINACYYHDIADKHINLFLSSYLMCLVIIYSTLTEHLQGTGIQLNKTRFLFQGAPSIVRKVKNKSI